jgi:hypothetical protein
LTLKRLFFPHEVIKKLFILLSFAKVFLYLKRLLIKIEEKNWQFIIGAKKISNMNEIIIIKVAHDHLYNVQYHHY